MGCRSLTSGTAAVVSNIEDFYGRTSGTTCYANTIDPSFSFHPDPQDSSLFLPQIPFIGWNDSVEVAVNERLGTLQQFISVDFTTEYQEAGNPDQNTELRFWNYEIRFQYRPTQQDSQPDILRFAGKADLTLHRGANGEWKVTTWVDHRGGVTDSTWGFLRGSNRL